MSKKTFSNAGMNDLHVIDAGTGESITEIHPGELFTIIPEPQEAETVPVNKNRKFIKNYPVAIDLVRAVGTDAVAVLDVMSDYIWLNSGVLRFKNGRLVCRKHIVEMLDGTMSRARVDKALAVLLQNGVIARCYVKGGKAYIVNPYVRQNGKRINTTLLALFSKTSWRKGEAEEDGRTKNN